MSRIEELFVEKSRLEKIVIMALLPVPFLATIYLLTQIKHVENEIRRECQKNDGVVVVVSNAKAEKAEK